jgi:hypothetical protein
VWRAAAPSIDFLSPDIYFPNFVEWAQKYARPGNPLFIPESRFGRQSAVHALYAFGAHDAIGFSPFSLESVEKPANHPLAQSYAIIAELAPTILAAQGKGMTAGVIPRVDFDGKIDDSPQQVLVGGTFALTVTFEGAAPPPVANPGATPAGGASSAAQRESVRGGIIIALAPDDFLIAGTGIIVTFAPVNAGDPIAGILSAEEGRHVNGRWVPTRRLNGDQTHQGRHIRLVPNEFSIQRVKLYRYR